LFKQIPLGAQAVFIWNVIYIKGYLIKNAKLEVGIDTLKKVLKQNAS
jgi:hypothetical protein